jgi:hypothetical protein
MKVFSPGVDETAEGRMPVWAYGEIVERCQPTPRAEWWSVVQQDILHPGGREIIGSLTLQPGTQLARKPNYNFEKRRKEQERKKKQEEKLRPKQENTDERRDDALPDDGIDPQSGTGERDTT